jgi:hypothetical protein
MEVTNAKYLSSYKGYIKSGKMNGAKANMLVSCLLTYPIFSLRNAISYTFYGNFGLSTIKVDIASPLTQRKKILNKGNAMCGVFPRLKY